MAKGFFGLHPLPLLVFMLTTVLVRPFELSVLMLTFIVAIHVFWNVRLNKYRAEAVEWVEQALGVNKT